MFIFIVVVIVIFIVISTVIFIFIVIAIVININININRALILSQEQSFKSPFFTSAHHHSHMEKLFVSQSFQE